METKEFVQNYNKIFNSVKMAEKPLKRDFVEIRLHSTAELNEAINNGFEIYHRIVKLNDKEFMCAFIKVSFDDLMTLQGK